MAFLTLLVHIWLIFTAITAHLVDDNTEKNKQAIINYRLPDNVMPVHYNVKIIPYIKENNFIFDGECNIKINIRRPTQIISLHALNLTIDEEATKLTDSSNDISYAPAAHFYNNLTEMLILHFNNELPPQFYILNMKFVGILHKENQGIFRSSYKNVEGNTVWIVATHFEPTWARRAFPCWDEPALKATFDISIKHHKSYIALSNMPVKEQLNDDNRSGTVWTHFDTTPVMSTYLVAFVVADFVRIPTRDKNINIWCRSQLVPKSKWIQQVAVRTEQLMEKYINISHMIPKMDHVAIPYEMTAMENWGLILYGEKFFAYDATSNTVIEKHTTAIIVTHEIAHQWFGNLASTAWWSYLWLKEGFATYFQIYFINQIFKDWRQMDLFVVKDQEVILQADSGKNLMPMTSEVNSPSEIESHFSISSYKKASIIIRMLQHIMSDEIFWKGLQIYVHTHHFFSATPDDLWFAMQTALDESEVSHNEYRLKEVMDTWAKQSNFPVVTLTRNYDTGETIVRQRHFHFDIWSDKQSIENVEDIDEGKWWIPLNFATQTNPNFNNTQPTHWLRPENQNKTIYGIDTNDWIIVNIQQTGYYIVNYDEINWQRIGNYLNSNKYIEIHVLNRAQIISNAFLLLTANQLPVSVFSDLMDYIPRETDYIAWYPVFTILKTIWKDFDLRDNQLLKGYLHHTFDKFIKKIGYDESPNENDFTKLTRITVLHWACIFDHIECKQMAIIKLNEHFTDPETHKISPNLKEWTYCMGMMEANVSTWIKLYNTYLNNPTNRKIIDFLSCSQNPDIFFNLLKMNCSEKEWDIYIKSFRGILKNQINNDIIFDYILKNWKNDYTLRHMSEHFILNTMIKKATTQQRLHKIDKYLENNLTPETKLIHFQNLIKKRKSYLLENAEKYATMREAILTKFK